MNEHHPIDRRDAPVHIPPLVGYIPRGEFEERAAWLLALKLAEDGKSWECLVAWTRSSPPLNGSQPVHRQELEWAPQTKVRKLPRYSGDYDAVPRLRKS